MEAKRLKGFPVVSLEDGSMAGKIQELIVDPEQKKVAGLLVGEKGLLKGKAQVISYQQVHNIGRDAVTVKSRDDITSIDQHPQLDKWKDYSFIGNGIISSEGDYIARVKDFTFNLHSGQIESLLLYDLKEEERGPGEMLLSIEPILKLGRDYVIADAAYRSCLTEKEKEEDELTGLSHLERRAVEHVLYQEAAHTIRDSRGIVIVEKGEKVSFETIKKARRSGKLYQVLFAAGVSELLENIDHTIERLDQGSQQLLEAWKNFQERRSRNFFRGSGGEEEKEEEGEAQGEAQAGPSDEPEEEEERQRQEGFHTIKENWEKIERQLIQEGREITQYSLERMKNYVIGKKVAHTVRDSEGNILVQRGEEITEEIAEIAEAQGKIPALFFGVMALEAEESLEVLRDKISSILQR